MAHRWIKYYRNSLADGELLDIKSNEGDQGIFLDSVGGSGNQSLYQELTGSSPQKKDDDCEDRPVSIFIAPLFLSYVVEHAKNRKTLRRVYPYWMPALIDSEGLVYPVENKLPWFARSVLEPVISQTSEFPVIAYIRDVDTLLATSFFTYESWDGFLNCAEAFFKRVTRKSFADFTIDGFVTCHRCCVIKAKTVVPARNILTLYDDLKSQETPQLLKKLLPPYPENYEPLPDDPDLFFNKDHYGQYNNEFPLSNSQRKSLLLFGKDGDGSILAVNGPPGTGKTTLLQSVIANEVVKAAINGERPPKIVASSTNNQAITNILDSFGSSMQDKKKQPERWLPGLASLGSYLIASDSKKQAEAAAKGYQILARSNSRLDGFYYDKLHTGDVSRPEEYFKLHFVKNYPEAGYLTVTEITDFLKDQIRHLTDKVAEMLDIVGKAKDTVVSVEGFASAIKQLQDTTSRLPREREELLKFRNKYNHFIDNNWSFLYYIIPSYRRSFGRKLILFLADHPQFSGLKSREAVEAVLIGKLEDIDRQIAETRSELENNTRYHTLLSGLLSDCKAVKPDKIGDGFACFTLSEINCLLDITWRHRAFINAVHYWEGKWLIKQKDEPLENNNSRIANLNRISYLTPLFISTFHTLPGFCACSEETSSGCVQKPLYGLFDILIVDEAGQVSPEVGVASFSLAKKALVVGDIHQIEPVWNIGYTKIDKGNLYEAGLIPQYNFNNLRADGLLCSSGTLMHLAQRSSSYQSHKDLGGTLLTEHRRCVDEIVAFSNHHVYHDLLQPMVGSLKGVRFSNEYEDIFIPPLAYINVRGYSEKRVGSRLNPTEAESVALWIKNYGALLLEHYHKKDETKYDSLKDIIAVITPFAAQKKEIYNWFGEYGVDPGITVGTVHALQGAEKPVVIFSPVYGTEHSGPLFFDRGHNMLNVALTRAQQHFIVIGNMALFNPANRQKPSGRLARYLLSDEFSELPSSFLFEKNVIHRSETRISTLSLHRKCLKKAVKVAKERLVIVSPFISINAIEADDLVPDIKMLVRRNIEVVIYTDKYLDLDGRRLKPNSLKGRDALRAAGAKLLTLNGIHNKSIAIDEDILIEGSFNWLSASRDENKARYDVSQVIMGDKAEGQIGRLLYELSSMQR